MDLANCKLCNRSGLFLSVSKEGLCKTCLVETKFETSQRARIINESLEIVQKSKNIDTILSRLDTIILHAHPLLRYEEKGIDIFPTLPSQLIKQSRKMKEDFIIKHLMESLELIQSKHKISNNLKKTVEGLSKVLLKIQDFKSKVGPYPSLIEFEEKVNSLLREGQLKIYTDKAQKYEFKGQKKKALDAYYEGLYYLMHDNIDDAMQSQSISEIKNKIIELGGEIIL